MARRRNARGRFVKGAHRTRRRRRSTSRAVARPKVRHVILANPRRRRRHAVRHASAHRTRRRHYRRNPSARSLMGVAKQAVVDALWITGGQMANRGLVKLVPASLTASVGIDGTLAIEGVLAVALGAATHRFVGPNAGRMVAAGALSAVLQDAIKLHFPTVGAYLSGYPSLSGYPMAGYPMAGVPTPPAITGFHRGLGAGSCAGAGTGLGDAMADYDYGFGGY